MSILRKKGQRALTHKQQRRSRRNVETRRRWRAWRAYTQPSYTRDPLDRLFKGIVQPSRKRQDKALHDLILRGRR